MRRPRIRLAALFAAGVVLAMAAAALAFNLFAGWKVESEATADIAYDLGLVEDEGTGRIPSYLVLDASYAIDTSEHRWTTPDERELAAWVAKHPEEGVVSYVAFDSWSCYAAVVSLGYYENEGSYFGDDESVSEVKDFDGYLVAYIDTTGEAALVSLVNRSFALIAIVGALFAATAGYLSGRRIEQSQDAQKRFYENMSHDLKTPLAAIRGYAEGAATGVVDQDRANAAILRETDRMTGQIEQILDLSRLEAGAVKLEPERVEVGAFVQDCLMPFEGIVRTRGLDVRLDLAAGSVQADPDLFAHAFENVLSNAMRHAGSFMAVRYDGQALSVENDGDLPAEDELAGLFDRFAVGAGGSTGIGLALTREICVLHGWTVHAERTEQTLVVRIECGRCEA